jgi:aspartyl-tRNA(Asn)/glutamyl-tRNA(Gln) amidotransferase subunit A
VTCCVTLDAVLADEPMQPLQPRPVKGMRLSVPTTVALDKLDDAVAKTLDRALEALPRADALIERIEVPEFNDVGVMNAKGGFAVVESYAWHRYLLTSKGDVYDPCVSLRILPGEGISAADYIDILNARPVIHRSGRSAHRALRRAGVADHGEHAASHRRSRRR